MSKSQMKTMLVTFFNIESIIHFELIPQGQTVNQAYCVEVLKWLHEAVCWSSDWILHHDNSPAHKALSVKWFLAQKSVTEMEHPPYSPDLALNDFWLFPKIKSALKVWRFQDIEDFQNIWWWHWKPFHNRTTRNVSNSGSIIGLVV